mgnify:CR=1 FL=1
MSGSPQQVVTDTLIVSLEDLMKRIGLAISETQAELDRKSASMQTVIENDELLRKYGLQATWYQMPSIELEIKMALSMHVEKRGAIENPVMRIAPMNALYKNVTDYDVTGTSTMKVKIVPVPPKSTV